MINFDNYPKLLQFTDEEISQMSLEDLSIAFKHAEKMLFGNNLSRWQQCMWSAIERVRHNPSKATLQTVLDHLEDHKRALGRQYATKHNMRVLLKYNEVERDIRWLVSQYALDRQSQPYLLKPKY